MSDIYVDGSGWNGRESRYAVVYENGRHILCRIPENKTNNTMEYYALIEALLSADTGDIIYTDSRLIEGQVVGNWKINKPHLYRLCMKARRIMKNNNIQIVWIPREKNKAGHLLDDVKNGN